jgi:hypothetical protein
MKYIAMKFGIRKPSINKSISARVSWRRYIRHSMKFKAPRGYGWLTNPKRAAYNRVYNRTTIKADNAIALVIMLIFGLLEIIASIFFDRSERTSAQENSEPINTDRKICPRCNMIMVLRDGRRGKFYGCSRFPRCRGTRDYISKN